MGEMKNWFMKEESGQGMVEYAFILVLVSIAAVALLKAIGTSVSGQFDQIRAGFPAA
ncbi:MAG: Flp family type IVb pilin [Lachnospiraceae bacterium]